MEVGRYLPVEGAEEVAVFHYLNFARKQRRLTLEEETKLLKSSRSGDRQARETLIDAKQVVIVALSETCDDDRLSLMDRIAEGNVALISACRSYLPRLDGSFRRYCQRKIREAIEHALAEVESYPVVVWECETHHSIASSGHGISGTGANLGTGASGAGRCSD